MNKIYTMEVLIVILQSPGNDLILKINLLRSSDAYMRQETNHHWFR